MYKMVVHEKIPNCFTDTHAYICIVRNVYKHTYVVTYKHTGIYFTFLLIYQSKHIYAYNHMHSLIMKCRILQRLTAIVTKSKARNNPKVGSGPFLTPSLDQ